MNNVSPADRTAQAPSGAAALELHEVTKKFGHVTALEGVDLHVRRGEILALLGDNGAGKSTLVKIMSGLHQPDHGTVTVDGARSHFASPAQAREAGVATVYQDLALVEVLDVATNMFIGQIPKRRLLADRRRMLRESREFLASLNATVASVETPIGMLSGGQRQVIAIARALRLGAATVILDEPTAALGVRETALVRDMIVSLKSQNNAVIIVTHDMELMFQIADRAQILRLGRVAGVREVAATTREEIVGLITGAVTDHVNRGSPS